MKRAREQCKTNGQKLMINKNVKYGIDWAHSVKYIWCSVVGKNESSYFTGFTNTHIWLVQIKTCHDCPERTVICRLLGVLCRKL